MREPQATLAAEAGMTVLRVAVEQWVRDDSERDLPSIMRDSVAALRVVTDGSTPRRQRAPALTFAAIGVFCPTASHHSPSRRTNT